MVASFRSRQRSEAGNVNSAKLMRPVRSSRDPSTSPILLPPPIGRGGGRFKRYSLLRAKSARDLIGKRLLLGFLNMDGSRVHAIPRHSDTPRRFFSLLFHHAAQVIERIAAAANGGNHP